MVVCQKSVAGKGRARAKVIWRNIPSVFRSSHCGGHNEGREPGGREGGKIYKEVLGQLILKLVAPGKDLTFTQRVEGVEIHWKLLSRGET